MNILLLAPQPFYQLRGTPIAVKNLAHVLGRNGYQVQILTYHLGENIRIPNVEVKRILRLPGIKNIVPGPSWKKLVCDIILLIESFMLIRRRRFDLIHAVEESAFIALILQFLFRIPFVYDMDSLFSEQMIDKYKVLKPLRGILEFVEKLTIRKSLGVVAVCRYLEEIACTIHPNKKVLRLEDISLLQYASQKAQVLKETLNINGTIILYVGNLQLYQGIDLLLESFKIAALKVPKVHLVIIGGSERAIQYYRQKSSDLGIGKRTHFLGQRPISQLASFLAQADVLVSPRIKGGNTPMKIYSYLESGRPILATRLPTHTQVLDDNIALLKRPEPKEMADGLVILISGKDLSLGLAKRAKERVHAEFTMNVFENKLLSFYQDLENELSSRKVVCKGERA